MKAVAVTASLIDLEVETARTDAIQSFVKQETIIVDIETDEGLTGTGYAYTIGTGGRAILELLRTDLLPRVRGRDVRAVEMVWRDLFWATHATTVGPVTSLALAAIDTALWDLRCKQAGLPLWLAAGGAQETVPIYDTEGGWLHLSTEDLVAGAAASIDRGWPGAKIKIGKPSPAEDVERLGAVREAVGWHFDLMVDANQAFTASEAARRVRLLEPFDLFWLEEPLPADDISGHAALARQTTTPVAVGESLYSVSHFREYLSAGAAGIVQVDAARIGGITPWLKTAHLAEAFNVRVAPHFLMELHVSLAAAVPNALYVEHIPQLRAVTKSAIAVVDGRAHPPADAGLGIDWDRDAMDDRRVA